MFLPRGSHLKSIKINTNGTENYSRNAFVVMKTHQLSIRWEFRPTLENELCQLRSIGVKAHVHE